MKKAISYLVLISFLANGTLFAAPRSIPVNAMSERESEKTVEKPQMARDLEGLDPREGSVNKGLRGSFTIRHFISGPWKGGTAVIELASDSSYAEVRIFDKDENLQRIYSIQPKSQNSPLKASEIRNAGTSEETSVTRSRAREAAVEAQTEQALQVQRDSEEQAPASGNRLRRGTLSTRRGELRDTTPEPENPREPAAQPAERERTTVVANEEPKPRKRTIRVRRKRSHPKKQSSLDTPLSGEAPKKEEDEYYYEEVVVVEKPKAEPRATRPVEEERPVQVAKAEPPPPPPPPSRSASRESSPPARDIEHSTPRQATPIATSGRSSGSSGGSSGSASTGSAAYDESNLPDVTDAVKADEKEAPAQSSAPSPERVSRKQLESDSWKPKPVQVAQLPGSAVEMPPAVVPQATKTRVPAEDAVDLKAAQQAAQKMESDSWAPKPGASKQLSDAELGLTQPASSVGSSGKRPRKGGGYDDVVPMSDQARGGSQLGAGDTWSPGTPNARLSTKDEQQLAMINTLKGTPQATPVKISRDINNPEEGVKPFYSLEKYSGAQYGRHREFERRVMNKQNKNSSVKGYEFYIDEVDRKQEKHYLYYYKIDPRTKKAKLIATEKHEKVTFLSNYDIGSEDKGKIVKE